ncbi:cyclic nucleotide-binding domain-containing protein [Thalassoroseus pseudoceratinae]|uniref:cyclic nucleotide-binding domain-containing protein n=1 Tax=Thalassoroseus pseudoceratinae TaxID=2713176 RepID=UPI001422A5AA|nr:cyclic nucleotide-binding domain-containing protein [Thalassoroseus pseudoceratinae]
MSWNLTLFQLANVLFCLSYAVRDILWLRLLSVVAGFCLLPYFLDGPKGCQNAPIFWQTVYISINGWNLFLLLRERRVIPLSADQERLRQLVFQDLSPREAHHLLSKAEWKSFTPSDVIIQAGVISEELVVLFHGHAAVEIDGNEIAALRDGQFVGEISYLTGGPTTADVVAVTEVVTAVWRRDDLQALFQRSPAIGQKLQNTLGQDMARKLSSQSSG